MDPKRRYFVDISLVLFVVSFGYQICRFVIDLFKDLYQPVGFFRLFLGSRKWQRHVQKNIGDHHLRSQAAELQRPRCHAVNSPGRRSENNWMQSPFCYDV